MPPIVFTIAVLMFLSYLFPKTTKYFIVAPVLAFTWGGSCWIAYDLARWLWFPGLPESGLAGMFIGVGTMYVILIIAMTAWDE